MSVVTKTCRAFCICKIDNLPAPHGDCDWKQLRHTDHYTTEECYLDCLTRHAETTCGCRDIYMPTFDRKSNVSIVKAGYFLRFITFFFEMTTYKRCMYI